MAALLVSLAVMSVVMTAALPAWKHVAQREKEAELVFRGEQYARAVALYRTKNANAFPASIDILVQGKYLRKKYLDPITNKEFEVIGAATAQLPPGGQPGGGREGPGRGRGGTQPPGAPIAQPPQGFTATAVSGGIMGVRSKSQDTSIRIYKGQTRYDQWSFIFTVANRPGGMAPGALNPGGPGGLPTPGPGGRGMSPGGRGDGRGRGFGAPGGFGLPPPQPPPRGPGAGSM
jgi:type II secretory pathway pseudopilin PulG